MALGFQLADQRRLGSDTHWGNEGFCIDVALHHPTQPDDVTLGLLTDFTRYDRAPDPVEWEIYRQSILTSTGWKLHQIWSPQFFRDPTRTLNQIQQSATPLAAESSPTTDEL